MDSSTTRSIADTLTSDIVAHRLQPGAKLGEQKLATQFGVSRTLIRQALFQMAQNRLIRMEPARGAFVAAPSALEAQQVFAVRRMLEAGLVRSFITSATAQHIATLRAHVAQEQAAVQRGDVARRTVLLGDFHVCMAQLLGNTVLAEMLQELLARCALITLLYQSASAADRSNVEHSAIVDALEAGDEALALQRMDTHLQHVQESLSFNTPPAKPRRRTP